MTFSKSAELLHASDPLLRMFFLLEPTLPHFSPLPIHLILLNPPQLVKSDSGGPCPLPAELITDHFASHPALNCPSPKPVSPWRTWGLMKVISLTLYPALAMGHCKSQYVRKKIIMKNQQEALVQLIIKGYGNYVA